jgi:alpha-amylase
MTEWALPASRLAAYQEAMRRLGSNVAAERLKPFLRSGGSWRNFKVKYPESDEMYARMTGLSHRLAAAEERVEADPDYLDVARQELYRGQCNCPYWHGAFGGLYLPHLRNAVYRHLIAADNALDDAEGRIGRRAGIEVADFNFDARQEVRLENDRLIAFVRPALGGHVYELDVRQALTNVLATLDRRPETYHAAIAAAATGAAAGHPDRTASIPDRVVMKQEGLERLLVYDRTPRKALVDHFFPAELALDDLIAGSDLERGDFVAGTYMSRVHRGADRVALMMDRPGWADGHAIHLRKTIALGAGSPVLDVHYILEELPLDVRLHFAIEFNLAAMAGNARDRYYADESGKQLGLLAARLDLPRSRGLTLTDEWLDLSIGLEWSSPAGLWCFPIETVSQSESGYEGVYQSSAVIPHWVVRADEARQWEVRIRWTFDRVPAARAMARPARVGLTEAATAGE